MDYLDRVYESVLRHFLQNFLTTSLVFSRQLMFRLVIIRFMFINRRVSSWQSLSGFPAGSHVYSRIYQPFL